MRTGSILFIPWQIADLGDRLVTMVPESKSTGRVTVGSLVSYQQYSDSDDGIYDLEVTLVEHGTLQHFLETYEIGQMFNEDSDGIFVLKFQEFLKGNLTLNSPMVLIETFLPTEANY